MNTSILFAWIGRNDLNSCASNDPTNLGPIGQAVSARGYSHLYLINNWDIEDGKRFQSWIQSNFTCKTHVTNKKLRPTDLDAIYCAAMDSITKADLDFPFKMPPVTYHLSPGTPQMAIVWLLISQEIKGELIESSLKNGVNNVDNPFSMRVKYLSFSNLPGRTKKTIEKLAGVGRHIEKEFESIIFDSDIMLNLLEKAKQIAILDYPVLIEGESGSGKESLANEIHNNSGRSKKPFVAINCGAIPESLFESELFGYVKGSFTGASKDHDGYFLQANGGTLFLDEIGELPLHSQVKLLRTLQEGTLRKIGALEVDKIDCRIIAATNRNLLKAVDSGSFRLDFYHRIAVGILKIPPLRERQPDIEKLIDYYLLKINKECSHAPGWVTKEISIDARELLRAYHYPGNIRELVSILTRSAIWSPDKIITATTVAEHLVKEPHQKEQYMGCHKPLTANKLEKNFSLKQHLEAIAKQYLELAVQESGGKRVKAAKLLGFDNYQTFTNWLKKYSKK